MAAAAAAAASMYAACAAVHPCSPAIPFLLPKRRAAAAVTLGRVQSRNATHRVTCFSSGGDEVEKESYSSIDNSYWVATGEVDTFSKYSGYIAAAATSEAELIDEYDAQRIAAIYKRRPFLLLRRIIQIIFTLGRWLAFRYLDSLSGRSDAMFKERAGDLRAALVQLGPAFVKIAQAVSSRPDVIPPAYLDELALLQDRIAPFSTDIALDMIKNELGVPVDLIFSEITLQPVAAASLGQVYQARLRPNGQLVAVKVQRPGVRAAIALDIFILRILAGYVIKIGRFNTDLQAVVDEWATSLFREMDYLAESQNGVRFRKCFGKLSDVFIPEMFPELSSRRVLVMEWVEGKKLPEIKDLHLVEVGVYCSLTQLLDRGFYHADPHPGNLIRTYDGKLAYIDFGMMGEIKQNLRNGLIEACLHLINRDFEALAGDFVTLGFLPASSQMSDVSKALTGVFQNAVSKGVRNISFGDLSGNLGLTMYQFKFRIPSYFSLVIRSLAVLEGIALSVDPNYKVLSSSYPWIARRVLTDSSPQLQSTLRDVLFKDGSLQTDRLESLITEALRSTTGQLTGSEKTAENNAKLIVKKTLMFALSEEADYVRDLLLDELAKGIDALNRAIYDLAAATLYSNIPMPLPAPTTIMEDEDFENLNTLRRLSSLLSEKSEEVTNLDMMNKSSTNNNGIQDPDPLLKEVSFVFHHLNSISKLPPTLPAVFEYQAKEASNGQKSQARPDCMQASPWVRYYGQ
eukprot:c26599_g1_i1 orf=673-2898(-)